MKILNEIEAELNHQDVMFRDTRFPECYPYLIPYVSDALPILVRVARAADRLGSGLSPKKHHEAACELEEALQQLREMRK